MNIDNLERQHKEIWTIFLAIEKIINLKNINNEIDELVRNINVLAGKLNIHIISEDKFLYPKLMESNDLQIKNIAIKYYDEMGHISNTFKNFKNKFNTKNKITNNMQEFEKEAKNMFKTLRERLEKEDNSLYPKIKQL